MFGLSPIMTRELTRAVQIRFNFVWDNVMQSTEIHLKVTQILVPPVYVIATSHVSNHGYKAC